MLRATNFLILASVLLGSTNCSPGNAEEPDASGKTQADKKPFLVEPAIPTGKSEVGKLWRTHCPPSSSSESLSVYMTRLSESITKTWSQTKYAHKAKDNARIGFTIQRSGVTKNVRITKSSGDQNMDRKALTIVKKSCPFSKLPMTAPDEVDAELTFGRVAKKN